MIRGLWTPDMIGWVLAIALLPPAAAALVTHGVGAGLTLGAALLAASAWQLLFRQSLGIPFSPSGAVTAVALTVLGPPDAALWQTVLAASFGLVIGELVFGGWGRNVIPAPVAALAFGFLSFPNLAPAQPDVMMAFAAGASGALLLATGILNLRTLGGFVLAFGAVPALAGIPPQITGALAFGLVFLVADPVASAATDPGRWITGALAGALAGLLAWAGPGAVAPQPVVFAALLAAIFAPLADYAVIAAAHARRTRPHG